MWRGLSCTDNDNGVLLFDDSLLSCAFGVTYITKNVGIHQVSFLTGPQHNGHPNADGALLVIPSRYVDLDEQVRTKDKFHASVVAKLQRRQGMTLSDL